MMAKEYEGFVKWNGTLVTGKIESKVYEDCLFVSFEPDGQRCSSPKHWLFIRPFTVDMLNKGTCNWVFSETELGHFSVHWGGPEGSTDQWQVISTRMRIEHFSDLIRIAVTCHTATGKTIDNWPQKVRQEGLKAQILDLAFNIPRTDIKDFIRTKATQVGKSLERLEQIREDLEKYQPA
jgi:hypothetical protein